MKDPGALFIEVGPGHELSALLARHPDKDRQQPVIDLVRHPDREIADTYFLLNKIGMLWLRGVKIAGKEFQRGEQKQRISLPAYPFTGQCYPLEEVSSESGQDGFFLHHPPGKKPDIADWFYLPGWERSPLLGADRLEMPRHP